MKPRVAVKKGQLYEINGKRKYIEGVFPSRGLASFLGCGYLSINKDGTLPEVTIAKLIKDVPHE